MQSQTAHYANPNEVKKQPWDAHYSDASAFVNSEQQLSGAKWKHVKKVYIDFANWKKNRDFIF